MMRRCLLIISLLIITVFAASAQRPDTVNVKSKADSITRAADSLNSRRFIPKVKKEKIYHPDSTHSPHTAVIRSLIFPGLGQAYNKKYWKMPLIYGGLTGIMLAIVFNARNYNDLLLVAQFKEKGIPLSQLKTTDLHYDLYAQYDKLSSAAIVSAKDYYRRTRDISILGFLAGWGIQTVDAYIDAKFIHSYSMDNNLSIKVSPTISTGPMPPFYAANFNTTFAPALKITFTLR